MKRNALLAGAVGLLCATWFLPGSQAGPAEDWSAIEALEIGPKEKPKTAAEARQITLQILATQEKAYRAFLRSWPTDPHAVDVQLQLAHLLSVKADFEAQPQYRADAKKLLTALAAQPDLPKERRADVHFAQVTLVMRGVKALDSDARSELLGQVRAFQASWLQDRRISALLAEVASLYDDQPPQKRLLLNEALALTADKLLRARIGDDLRRIDQLGLPIALKFRSIQGEDVDVAKLSGKVVVIVFFATWSLPSVTAVDALPDWPADQVALLAVSLDRDLVALRKALDAVKFTAPVGCDGKGWESPLVRQFGINALPTTWVLDKQGRLRTLNAKTPGPLVKALLEER